MATPTATVLVDPRRTTGSIDNRSSGIRAAMVFHCCAANTIDLGFEQYNYFKNPTHKFIALMRDGDLVIQPQ